MKYPYNPEEQPPKPESPHSRRVHPLEQRADPAMQQSQRPQQPPGERMVLNMDRVEPLLTYALIAMNVVVYFAGSLSPELGNQFLNLGANYTPAIFGNSEYYRMFTSMFLHAGIAHLFFNMYALSFLGRQTEQLYGRWRFLVMYVLGGLTGSLLSAAFGDPRIPSVGASGAVFALLGVQIVYLYRYRHILGQAGRGVLQQYVIMLAFNLFLGFTVPNIDNLGHMGGLLGGVILGWILSPILTAKMGYDEAGSMIRVLHVAQRDNSGTASVIYALGLVGFTLVAGFLLF